jgi:hypothetical protein
MGAVDEHDESPKTAVGPDSSIDAGKPQLLLSKIATREVKGSQGSTCLG